MNHNPVLDTLVTIRRQLIQPRYEKGELSGHIVLSAAVREQLTLLAAEEIMEPLILLNNEYISLDKLSLPEDSSLKVPVTLYTKNLHHARYYETVNECLEDHPYHYPTVVFYIHEIAFFSAAADMPAVVKKYKDVLRLIELLISISDYVIDTIGEPKELVFFEKRKLNLFIQYSQNDLRSIDYLEALATQLKDAHDKKERKSIFIAELVAFLFPHPVEERFSRLLASFDTVYDNYQKSHSLYLEKFSYHDLKSKLDKDKLDYTKKIYATVNDIQSKLIAVPAAFLLVLAQFDLTDRTSLKNTLITAGALLFSILLDILLRNQFGVLKYIETEILQFKSELSNTQTNVDVAEFVNSFAHLQTIANKQRIYLWIFRIIVWLVPLTAILMMAYKA